MNLSLVVMSKDYDKACKQVIQGVLKTVIQLLPVQVNLIEATNLLKSLTSIEWERWVPMNNMNTQEMLTNVALGFVKETISSKLIVNKNIFQPNPRCVLGVLSCIFSYLHAFLLLDDSIYEALQQIAKRSEVLAFTFPNNITDHDFVSTWTYDNMRWLMLEILKAVDAVFQRIVTVAIEPNLMQNFTIPHHLRTDSESTTTTLDNVNDIVMALNKIPDVDPNSTLGVSLTMRRIVTVKNSTTGESAMKKARTGLSSVTSSNTRTNKQNEDKDHKLICAHYWCDTICKNVPCRYSHKPPGTKEEALALCNYCKNYNLLLTNTAKNHCRPLLDEEYKEYLKNKDSLTTKTAIVKSTSKQGRGRGRTVKRVS